MREHGDVINVREGVCVNMVERGNVMHNRLRSVGDSTEPCGTPFEYLLVGDLASLFSAWEYFLVKIFSGVCTCLF